jgi:hypothetical protein
LIALRKRRRQVEATVRKVLEASGVVDRIDAARERTLELDVWRDTEREKPHLRTLGAKSRVKGYM